MCPLAWGCFLEMTSERYNRQFLSLVGLAPPSFHIWLVLAFNVCRVAMSYLYLFLSIASRQDGHGDVAGIARNIFSFVVFSAFAKHKTLWDPWYFRSSCQNDRCGFSVVRVYSWEINLTILTCLSIYRHASSCFQFARRQWCFFLIFASPYPQKDSHTVQLWTLWTTNMFIWDSLPKGRKELWIF